MFVLGPLFSLFVLSFRVLPTHPSERSCHNRVGCWGRWRSGVEVCRGASAWALSGCLPCLGGGYGRKPGMIMRARNKPLSLSSFPFLIFSSSFPRFWLSTLAGWCVKCLKGPCEEVLVF